MLTNYTNAPQFDFGIIGVAAVHPQVASEAWPHKRELRHILLTVGRDILRLRNSSFIKSVALAQENR